MGHPPHANTVWCLLASRHRPDAASGLRAGECEMPVTTPNNVERDNFGPVEVGSADLDGYTVNFLHFSAPVDMNQMLRGLPGNICHCPHWGVVTDGRMTVRYGDHEEVVEA